MDNLFLTNKRTEEKEEETKTSKFQKHKDQTIKSLQEVENFLTQTRKALNHVKLYKILK